MADKLVIICTHDDSDPEMATLPFVMATAAQASDIEVLMAFQSEAVKLVKRGVAEGVAAPNLPPLKELMDAFVEMDGRMIACGPCVKTYGLSEDEFVEGAVIANAGVLVSEIATAVNVLSY